MKKKNIIVTLLCIIGIACISTRTYATSVYYDFLVDGLVISEVDEITVSVGKAFSVNVYATDVNGEGFWGSTEAVTSFGFDIDFDTTAFTLEGATVGADFMNDSLLIQDTDVAGSTFPGPTGDNILLATMDFRVEMSGVHNLSITNDVNNLFEGLRTSHVNSSLAEISMAKDITVNAPVPEPSTVLLFGVGVAALVGVRRKKR